MSESREVVIALTAVHSPTNSRPAAYPPTYPDSTWQQASQTAETQAARARNLAIAALVVAIVGLFVLPLFGGIAAIILGALSVGANPVKTGNGMAYTAIVLGAAQTLLYFVAAAIMIVLLVSSTSAM